MHDDTVFFYLEKISGSSNKFWCGIQEGPYFLGHWGRIGTKGMTKMWAFDHVRQAEKMAWEKKVDKTNSGYIEVRDPPVDISELKNKLTEEILNRPYGYVWQASSIPPESLIKAAKDCDDLLVDIGRPLGTQVETVDDEGRIRAMIQGSSNGVDFGYPPKNLILDNSYVSRSGYLSSEGTGTGILHTEMDGLDMALRLYLGRLSMLSGVSLHVEDTLASQISGCYFEVSPKILNKCKWSKYYSVITNAVRERGWFPGGLILDGQEEFIDNTPLSLNNYW